MEEENISRLIQRIKSISSNASDGVLQDAEARTSLLQASRELTTALEPPYEVASRVALISGGGNMCVRLAVDLDLFDQLTLSELPMSPEQLAVQSQADPALVRRILRVLAGMGFVGETVTVDQKQAFVATAVTKHMTRESVKAGIRFLYVATIACSSQYDMFAKHLHLSVTIKDSLFWPKPQPTSNPMGTISRKVSPMDHSTSRKILSRIVSRTGRSNPA